ncbi:MAG: hypothetical protein CUN57_01885, partial [Phototrophicales bacterium]
NGTEKEPTLVERVVDGKSVIDEKTKKPVMDTVPVSKVYRPFTTNVHGWIIADSVAEVRQ